MIKRLVIIIVIILTFWSPARAIQAQRFTLNNGLTVLFSERHNLPVVHIVLLVKVSPMNEPPDKAGLANLVAELLPEGTKALSSEQIAEEISFLGAKLSTSQSRDFATVGLSVLKKHLYKAMKIYSQVLLEPSFKPEEITRKKEIIKGSLKQSEEDPGFVAQKTFIKALYGKHPYGRLIRGTQESIDRITREDIVEFYKTYYRPNNSILAVVGDLTRRELIELLDQYFSSWTRGEIPETKEYQIPQLRRPKVITIDREITQANIVFGHLGISRDNPDYYALGVMNYILGGGGFASRLMSIIRDQMGLAYDVHSFFTTSKYPGRFQVGLQTKNSSAMTTIKVILREIKRIKNEPVTERELKDAKAYLTGSFPRRIDTMSKIASFLVRTEFYGLGLDYDRRYPELINSITKEDILRVARRYLHDDAFVLVVVGNLKETGPIEIETH